MKLLSSKTYTEIHTFLEDESGQKWELILTAYGRFCLSSLFEHLTI